MVLALEYDCIRVFRRVVKHRRVYTMAAEDIIFWFHVSIVVFCSVYEMNNGIIRGFIIVSQVLGAALYRYAFGRFFVKYISKILLFVLMPLKKMYWFIKIRIQGAFKRIRSRLAERAAAKKRLAEGEAAEKRPAEGAGAMKSFGEAAGQKEKTSARAKKKRSRGGKAGVRNMLGGGAEHGKRGKDAV